MNPDDHGTAPSPGPLFDAPARNLARTTDPNTSKAAAQEVVNSPHLGDEQRRTMALLEANPGSTANDLSRLAGDADPRRINRRLGELRSAQKAYRSGTKRDPVTNKACAVWWPA